MLNLFLKYSSDISLLGISFDLNYIIFVKGSWKVALKYGSYFSQHPIDIQVTKIRIYKNNWEMIFLS